MTLGRLEGGCANQMPSAGRLARAGLLAGESQDIQILLLDLLGSRGDLW